MKMMFADRKDAGKKLGKALEDSRGPNTLVLAIPKGGIEVGYEIAKALECRMSVIVTRKLPFPDQPESGFGAVAEDGSMYVISGFDKRIAPTALENITRTQIDEIKRRVSILRAGKELPDLAGKKIILVDDGIAMGSTMMASIALCRRKEPAEIIVASPVAGPRVMPMLKENADIVKVLEIPTDFHAVAQVYRNWYDVSDNEAIEILEKAGEEGIYL